MLDDILFGKPYISDIMCFSIREKCILLVMRILYYDC